MGEEGDEEDEFVHKKGFQLETFLSHLFLMPVLGTE